jgi:hypothetical protein
MRTENVLLGSGAVAAVALVVLAFGIVTGCV